MRDTLVVTHRTLGDEGAVRVTLAWGAESTNIFCEADEVDVLIDALVEIRNERSDG